MRLDIGDLLGRQIPAERNRKSRHDMVFFSLGRAQLVGR